MKILIGVPTLNGWWRLDRFLFWLQRARTAPGLGEVRLVVCDDGSCEEQYIANRRVIDSSGHKEVRERFGLIYMTNDERRGISKTWNRLVRAADADVCVLVNDDIEVVDFWLDALVYSVTQNPGLGMVGLNSYSGLTRGQYEEAVRISLKTSIERGVKPEARRDDDPGPEPPGIFDMRVFQPELDYKEAKLLVGDGTLLSSYGPVFAFRRELFDLVGGFDERYFVFCEELDFGVQLLQRDYYHAMLNWPPCFHEGGATNSNKQNLDAASEMTKSYSLFCEKWGKGPAALRAEAHAKWLRRWPSGAPRLREWNTMMANWN